MWGCTLGRRTKWLLGDEKMVLEVLCCDSRPFYGQVMRSFVTSMVMSFVSWTLVCEYGRRERLVLCSVHWFW